VTGQRDTDPVTTSVFWLTRAAAYLVIGAWPAAIGYAQRHGIG
jgi:hypothetical protein